MLLISSLWVEQWDFALLFSEIDRNLWSASHVHTSEPFSSEARSSPALFCPSLAVYGHNLLLVHIVLKKILLSTGARGRI
jgi:hypothetical protein